jgi:hypothetical protein
MIKMTCEKKMESMQKYIEVLEENLESRNNFMSKDWTTKI